MTGAQAAAAAAPARREVNVRFSDHVAEQCGVAWHTLYNPRPGDLGAAIVERTLLRSAASIEAREQPTGDVALVGVGPEDREQPLVYIEGMELAEVKADLVAWAKERRRHG